MKRKEREVLKNQTCPICHKKTLTLTQEVVDIPFFGKTFIFTMFCSNCKFKQSDVESVEKKEPCKYKMIIESEKDLNVRVVKSSTATVKLQYIATIEPRNTSNGYVTNVEGILRRIKEQIEFLRDTTEDENEKKKARKLIKKITRIIWGKEKATLIIEDPEGNSAIISDKAIKTKLK